MRTAGGAPAGVIVAADTELASRSPSPRAPPPSVPGASTPNSGPPRPAITTPNRAAAFIARTRWRLSGGRMAEARQEGGPGRPPRTGRHRPAHLGPRRVGQLGVHQDHVWFGGACAFEPVLARALLEHGVPAALQQHSEPARRLFAVPGEKHEWQSALWHSLRHAPLRPTACR